MTKVVIFTVALALTFFNVDDVSGGESIFKNYVENATKRMGDLDVFVDYSVSKRESIDDADNLIADMKATKKQFEELHSLACSALKNDKGAKHTQETKTNGYAMSMSISAHLADLKQKMLLMNEEIEKTTRTVGSPMIGVLKNITGNMEILKKDIISLSGGTASVARSNAPSGSVAFSRSSNALGGGNESFKSAKDSHASKPATTHQSRAPSQQSNALSHASRNPSQMSINPSLKSKKQTTLADLSKVPDGLSKKQTSTRGPSSTRRPPVGPNSTNRGNSVSGRTSLNQGHTTKASLNQGHTTKASLNQGHTTKSSLNQGRTTKASTKPHHG